MERGKLFCIKHWVFLSCETQDELIENYTPGQCDDKELMTKAFRKTLKRAREELELEDAADW